MSDNHEDGTNTNGSAHPPGLKTKRSKKSTTKKKPTYPFPVKPKKGDKEVLKKINYMNTM